MRGISPIVATVVLLGLAAIAGISVYFWSMSFEERPKPTEEPVKINVRPVNSTTFVIANLGMKTLDLSKLNLSNNAKLVCESNELIPGETVKCQIKTTSKGEVAIIIPGAKTSTIIVNTGDIDAPEIKSISLSDTKPLVDETITVTAQISDNVEVKNATLYYRSPSGNWQTTSMTLVSGDSKSGTWSGTFTPSSVGNWEYMVEAYDNSSNGVNSTAHSVYVSVVKFVSPTPSDNQNINGDFTINLSLSGTPEKIVLDFNETNFTIYGGDEIYYLKLDEDGNISEDVWGNNWSTGDRQIYVKSVMGVVPTSTSQPLDGWTGENLERGDFDWCGGTGGGIYYAKNTVNSPTPGQNYTLIYNGTEVWDLRNTTNIYFDAKFNVSSSSFSYVGVCLIDTNGKTACHKDTGTFSANSVRHYWYTPYTSPIKDGTYFTTETGFDWGNVTAFKLVVTANTNSPFTMQLAPVRYAFPSNSHTTGLWGDALNVLMGKQTDVQQNWCWTGSVVLLKPGRHTVNNKTFTATVWFKSTNSNGYTYGVISLLGDAYWCDGFDIIKTGSQLKYRIGYAPCTSNHYHNNTYLYTDWSKFGDGQWHMVGISLNNTNMSIYEDGQLVGSTTLPQEMYAGTDWGFIGAPGTSITWSGQPFWGYIDEYHLFNNTLTPEQIKLLYHLEYGKYYAKLHNLDPGTYSFKVYATTSNGDGHTEERDVNIVG